MNKGDVIRTTYFQHFHADRTITGWKAPKDSVYILVLLGIENKDGTDPLDPIQALQDLGYQLPDKPEGI